MAAQQLAAVLKPIEAFAGSAPEATRRVLANALRDLAVSLETPNDTLMRVAYQPLELMVAQIAVDLGLFKLLAASEKHQTAQDLAVQTNTDPALLDRILRYLASFRFIKEEAEHTYSASGITKTFARSGYEDGIWFHFHFYNPILMATPRFLKDNKYQNPKIPTNVPTQKAFGTELPAFLWLHQNPEYLNHFVKFMSDYHEGKPSWTSVVDIQGECKDWDPKEPIFVDIGGGLGFQSVEFRKAAAGIGGRIINQDLQETLDQAPEHEGVEKMVHDFFTPQPAKGAKYYYLRNILHDYADERALELLKPLIDAAGKTSTILIDELVLPDTGADRQAAQQDIAMMITLGAMERTEAQWKALLERAGLQIKKLSKYSLSMGDSVIEAVPA